MMQGDQKVCWMESIRTQERQIAATQTKHHEGEDDAGIRTVGRRKETKGETRQKESKTIREGKRNAKRENIVLQTVIVVGCPSDLENRIGNL
ncbi:MAG: hypothetical protein ABJC87_14715, partial [Roseobacter sp.]